jgi:hypothetical protein
MNLSPIVLALAGAACSAEHIRYTETNPQQFVGKWVLARAGGTWSDTTVWNPDGSMGGSTNHPVPPDARWVVRTTEDGAQSICVSGGNQSNCQAFRMSADTLIWGVGADADRFRHVLERPK